MRILADARVGRTVVSRLSSRRSRGKPTVSVDRGAGHSGALGKVERRSAVASASSPDGEFIAGVRLPERALLSAYTIRRRDVSFLGVPSAFQLYHVFRSPEHAGELGPESSRESEPVSLSRIRNVVAARKCASRVWAKRGR